MQLNTKRELLTYLKQLEFQCDTPNDTELTYIYFTYELSYLPHICVTVSGDSVNIIKLICAGLLHIEQHQPTASEGGLISKVLRGLYRGLDLIDDGSGVVDMQPQKYCEMLGCSGVVVSGLGMGEMAVVPRVEVYSSGTVVYNDYISWLLTSAKE